ncbi:FtsP/CotA-like multicopper oxidase with cupredoxin domain [Tamaricihabitans halophyticus]|uniref:Multicopper oxidase CueO n=1 Tax=Tamaricihabitans halophyticus TaxID=1262583 RepID=A0A4R2RC22_9PSEU|nr:multicopper oxidase domain-containing protein [Tamaricihabitans halophyticus]TCP57271.1 FtsP/CotA-like multicopper oxidase with cupredoxin domain [Tamaricihabitans halophyticus]
MTMSRRRFLGAAAGAGAAFALAGCGRGAGSGQTADLLASELQLPQRFRVPLPIPRVAKPARSDATTDYYEITQRVADVEIVPGYKTPVFGYDGEFPGPTIRSTSGRKTVVTHRNELPVPTVVHLHGGHTPAEHDGYPTDLVFPKDGNPGDFAGHGDGMLGDITRGSRTYEYPMRQAAATLWYHDHRMDFTGPQVWRGLAGFHLIHDDVEAGLSLPHGDRDIPLMICDRAFEADGAFRYPAVDPTLRHVPGVREEYMEGVAGDVVVVNGAPWPELEVDAARYRFRLLNASNARRYRLSLDPNPSGGDGFVQIASDVGFLAQPLRHDRIDLAPAERSEVIVDFSRYPVGTEIVLRNELGNGSTAEVMRFVVARKAADDSTIPERLVEIEPYDAAAAKVHREWSFTRGRVGNHAGWTINGKAFDPNRIDAEPKLGELEVWRFYSDLHHPVHIHLSPFQVISRNGRAPGPYDAGWKDTVDIPPTDYVEVAIRFSGFTGKYMMHCHNLEHEDMAMMSAFETVD